MLTLGQVNYGQQVNLSPSQQVNLGKT